MDENFCPVSPNIFGGGDAGGLSSSSSGSFKTPQPLRPSRAGVGRQQQQQQQQGGMGGPPKSPATVATTRGGSFWDRGGGGGLSESAPCSPRSLGFQISGADLQAAAGAAALLDSNVKVFVRARPLNPSELAQPCVQVDGDESVVVSSARSTNGTPSQPQRFTFDRVLDENATQEELFESAVKPIVENCLLGYNSSFFAYGQTGSGKTYTMFGALPETSTGWSQCAHRGVIPRMFEHLLARAAQEEALNGTEFLCKCSFVEIYNEQVNDLLDPSKRNLKVVDAQSADRGAHIKDATERLVKSAQDMYDLIAQGLANRKTATTNMNWESSRSHSVITCLLERKHTAPDGTFSIRYSKLNLVDLAGSERQKSSGATGERLKEASNINKSLSNLGLVIKRLIEAQGKKTSALPVPYRDSKLTHLLEESLGGNAFTAIVANISPSSGCHEETLSTLQFARRAKFLPNKAHVNEVRSSHEQEYRLLRFEVEKLKEVQQECLKREADTASRLTRLQSELEETNGLASRTDEELGSLQHEMSGVTNSVECLKEEVRETMQKAADSHTAHQALLAKLALLEGDCRVQHQRMQTDVAGIRGEVEDTAHVLQVLAAKVGGCSGRDELSETSREVEKMVGVLIAMQEADAKRKDAVISLHERVRTLAADVEQLQSLHKGVGTREAPLLEDRFSNLAAKLTDEATDFRSKVAAEVEWQVELNAQSKAEREEERAALAALHNELSRFLLEQRTENKSLRTHLSEQQQSMQVMRIEFGETLSKYTETLTSQEKLVAHYQKAREADKENLAATQRELAKLRSEHEELLHSLRETQLQQAEDLHSLQSGYSELSMMAMPVESACAPAGQSMAQDLHPDQDLSALRQELFAKLDKQAAVLRRYRDMQATSQLELETALINERRAFEGQMAAHARDQEERLSTLKQEMLAMLEERLQITNNTTTAQQSPSQQQMSASAEQQVDESMHPTATIPVCTDADNKEAPPAACSPDRVAEASSSSPSRLEAERIAEYTCKTTMRGHNSYVTSLTVSGGHVFSGSSDGNIKAWRTCDGICAATLQGHNGAVNALAATDTMLFSSSHDGTVKAWRLSDCGCASTLRGGSQCTITALAVSDEILYRGSSDGMIQAWRLSDYRVCATLQAHDGLITSLAVGDSGVLYSTCADDHTIKAWSVPEHTCLNIMRGHSGAVWGLAVSSDKLFSGSSDGTIKVWDVPSYRCIATLSAHSGAIRALAVTQPGSICTEAPDADVVWRLSDYSCAGTLFGHGGAVRALVIAGEVVYSGSEDNTIKVWHDGATDN
eukprot:jgi/Chlat1/6570/Chrsp45S06036